MYAHAHPPLRQHMMHRAACVCMNDLCPPAITTPHCLLRHGLMKVQAHYAASIGRDSSAALQRALDAKAQVRGMTTVTWCSSGAVQQYHGWPCTRLATLNTIAYSLDVLPTLVTHGYALYVLPTLVTHGFLLPGCFGGSHLPGCVQCRTSCCASERGTWATSHLSH